MLYDIIQYNILDVICFILDADYRLCIAWIMHQQLREYKVEDILYLG
jgi:hypothetical protein